MSPQNVERNRLERLIFQTALRRYTQDSPILPDVWFEYGASPDEPVDLLLTPMRQVSPGDLFRAVREGVLEERQTERWTEAHPNRRRLDLAYSQSTVVARLWFDELVRVILPLAGWPMEGEGATEWGSLGKEPIKRQVVEDIQGLDRGGRTGRGVNLAWMVRIVGTIQLARRNQLPKEEQERDSHGMITSEHAERLVDAVSAMVREMTPFTPPPEPQIFSVSRNRQASVSVWRSIPAMKADAARRLFELSCSDLQWAVLDSGIDARSPAFRLRDGEVPRDSPFQDENGQPANNTRIVATYDFTRIRPLLSPDQPDPNKPASDDLRDRLGDVEPGEELRRHLLSGRQIDWDLIAPFLEIRHEEGQYEPPQHEHGTHVASILGGDWTVKDEERRKEKDKKHVPLIDHDLLGVCPDIRMYDIRVLDQNGRGSEFSVIAALQFVRHLNANKDNVVVHGVNLSLSIPHDVANYACGRTPVCEECQRLVGAGVIVVTAAGNEGYIQYVTAAGLAEGYRNISITDPGNTEGVITVGSTHRYRPHTYGVSYFSSRGPTGDGRLKPDVVAPGEKIWAAVPGERVKSLDGTSMATPHVSGAAALLMARHRELVGQPERVKQVLCQTATDLGRERYFQGSGMVDVLRAIQAV